MKSKIKNKRVRIIIYTVLGLIAFLAGVLFAYMFTTKKSIEQVMWEVKPKKNVYVDFDGVEHHTGEKIINSWGIEEEIDPFWIEWREEYDAIFEQMIKDDGLVIAKEDYSTLVEYYGIIYGMNETATFDFVDMKGQVQEMVEIMDAYDDEMYEYWENGNKEDAVIVRKYVNKDLMEKQRQEIHDNFMILLNNQTKGDIQKGIDELQKRLDFEKSGIILGEEIDEETKRQIDRITKQINLLESIKKNK